MVAVEEATRTVTVRVESASPYPTFRVQSDNCNHESEGDRLLSLFASLPANLCSVLKREQACGHAIAMRHAQGRCEYELKSIVIPFCDRDHFDQALCGSEALWQLSIQAHTWCTKPHTLTPNPPHWLDHLVLLHRSWRHPLSCVDVPPSYFTIKKLSIGSR